MLQWSRINRVNRTLLVSLGFGLLILVMYFSLSPSWYVPLITLLAVLGWGAVLWIYQRDQAEQASLGHQLEHSKANLHELIQSRAESERRLEIILRINHSLALAGSDTMDERDVMNNSLAALTDLVGAIGCSFVPVDEWQQPLPPFTHGRLPEPVLRAWAIHLADGMLRTRCGSCRVLHSNPGGCPLHPEQIGDTLIIQCLPLLRSEPIQPGADNNEGFSPVLGVLHIYLPPGRRIDPQTQQFLDILLREIANAYESAHLRAQEVATLRQIQLLHAPESDLNASLSGLLDGLKQALEVDWIVVRLRPTTDERLSNLTIFTGSLEESAQALIDQALEEVSNGQTVESAPGVLPARMALPISLPDGQILGMLLAASNQPYDFHPRQKTILQTVAAQAALLVENERLIRLLEYKAVIQERTRLAREIHDGLAQTLAFLKLQAGQMQSYLAQGDLARLSQVLKDNYQTLAEAYLDTRQAIDNLRITPQDGLGAWVERTLNEFANTTQMGVEALIDPGAAARAEAIPLEIQAQLIRIVQEALSNVRKHARARCVTTTLREWKNDLIIEVRDDGLGFESGDVPEISRHGLRGMRERAEMIGADFQVISQEHKGTTIRLVLPSVLEERSSQ